VTINGLPIAFAMLSYPSPHPGLFFFSLQNSFNFVLLVNIREIRKRKSWMAILFSTKQWPLVKGNTISHVWRSVTLLIVSLQESTEKVVTALPTMPKLIPNWGATEQPGGLQRWSF